VGSSSALATKRSSEKKLENFDARTLLDELEAGIEELRHAYDKYFTGVDRVPPSKLRTTVERRLRDVERVHFTSTAMRFRMHGLRARFVTYAHYWTRVLDQMERGVYRRDLARAARRSAMKADALSERSAAGANGHVDEGHVKEVFRELVRAKRAAGESIDGITYAALMRKISREAPKLVEKHGCAEVRFEVATVNGKVHLRARPA
jgi:hypothetical protein